MDFRFFYVNRFGIEPYTFAKNLFGFGFEFRRDIHNQKSTPFYHRCAGLFFGDLFLSRHEKPLKVRWNNSRSLTVTPRISNVGSRLFVSTTWEVHGSQSPYQQQAEFLYLVYGESGTLFIADTRSQHLGNSAYHKFAKLSYFRIADTGCCWLSILPLRIKSSQFFLENRLL